MKYAFTTLATGNKYLMSAVKFAYNLNEKCKSHKMIIATDVDNDPIQNVEFYKIPKERKLTTGRQFNYNLKYFPIQCASDFDVVIYVDADWRIYEGFEEKKLISFLDKFVKSNIDFLFERPHKIGASKNDSNCFWKNKIHPYNLLNTPEYDECDVCNEQFLLFRGGNKLKNFCNAWEKRCEYLESIDGWAFAEGVEIGMSAKDAGLISEYSMFRELNQFFKFNSVSGVEYTRF
jgi:hypothetical protein